MCILTSTLRWQHIVNNLTLRASTLVSRKTRICQRSTKAHPTRVSSHWSLRSLSRIVLLRGTDTDRLRMLAASKRKSHQPWLRASHRPWVSTNTHIWKWKPTRNRTWHYHLAKKIINRARPSQHWQWNTYPTVMATPWEHIAVRTYGCVNVCKRVCVICKFEVSHFSKVKVG